jgi:hypothetical protein
MVANWKNGGRRKLINVGWNEDGKNKVPVIYQLAIKSPGPGIAQGY